MSGGEVVLGGEPVGEAPAMAALADLVAELWREERAAADAQTEAGREAA